MGGQSFYREESSSCLENGKYDEEGSASASKYDAEGSTSAMSRTSGNSEDELKLIQDQLSKRESENVFRLRIVVVLILIAAGLAVSITVFYLTRAAEKEEFQLQYDGVAEKIISSFEHIMVEIAAVSGLGVAASANSIDSGSEWPFVTLNNFQQRAGNAISLSGTLYVSISPLVEFEQLALWEHYVGGKSNEWIAEGIAFQEHQGLNNFTDHATIAKSWLSHEKVDPLHFFDDNGFPRFSETYGPYLPRWQTSPVLLTSMVNENLLEQPSTKHVARRCLEEETAILGGFVTAPPGSASHPNHITSFLATLLSMWEGKAVDYQGDPMAQLVIPVFDTFDPLTRRIVAVMDSTIHWKTYFRDLLPSHVNGITVVVVNECDGAFTYEVHGDQVYSIAFGDQHDRGFQEYKRDGTIAATTIKDGTAAGIELNQEGCAYSVHVYPTNQYYSSFVTSDPIIICTSVALVFVFTISMFFFYDTLVERRQRLILAKATQSTAIVSSLFPRQVRDRLLDTSPVLKEGKTLVSQNHRIKTFLNGQLDQGSESQPIADLFPHCTVFFADIAGFTAWSSTREPAQVFVLLQAVYQSFDKLAKKRGVFKVETIGDSYVAVTGLPEPQESHASIMARFAWDCVSQVDEITRKLEVTLGPDTGDLHMRFGLHSGPVTAGVLRGDRARFQLFGDTVNMASRMETTGVKGRIQVSQATADILIASGKGSWLTPRQDIVNVKGKGVINTSWLSLRTSRHDSIGTATTDDSHHSSPRDVRVRQLQMEKHEAKRERLVDWISDTLLEHIKRMVAVRQHLGTKDASDPIYFESLEGTICLDEVKDTITMPEFDAKASCDAADVAAVQVPKEIVSKLRDYVGIIAKSYRDNPFHNFEHACHVTMSVNKLLKRIVAPDIAPEALNQMGTGEKDMDALIHDFTHGITSDPLAVFAISFSALIHDVDHQGVSNADLVKEVPEMGVLYRNKSVAEQNSLDVAWDVLMMDEFQTLRQFIFGTHEELMRFRQLIVNIVLATDIFDKEINDLRKQRWQQAFSKEAQGDCTSDLRATIVIEHIIQASDVAHTMQHWHVYQKWNRRLFTEMYAAFKSGRMQANPATFWYKGELGFLDNYVIPLGKKLKECNVFGVSSDEYLNYAVRNRAEWEERGGAIVEGMVKELDTYHEQQGFCRGVTGETCN